MKKLWVFIGRMNPPHIWHLSTIEKSLKDNDLTLVLLGLKKLDYTYTDEDNPLNFFEIRELLEKKYNDNKKIKILPLPDRETDEEWIIRLNQYLFDYYMNVSECEWPYDELNIYFWDIKNDSAYKAIIEYKDIISTHNVGAANMDYNMNLVEVPREESYIEYNSEKYKISWTNLRKALREWNLLLAEKFCDREMFEEIKNFF